MGKSATWPDKNQATDFNKIVESLEKVFGDVYGKLVPKKTKKIPWSGLPHGSVLLLGAHCDEPRQTLKDLDENDQHSPLRQLLSIAVQLGMEQGARCFCDKNRTLPSLMRAAVVLRDAKMLSDAIAMLDKVLCGKNKK